jgi:hypothetical protein
MLAVYRRHGNSAGVRRFYGAVSRITAAQQEMCCESTEWIWVQSGEELSQMGRLQEGRGKTDGDRAT